MVRRLRPAALPGLGASAPISNVSATEWNAAKGEIAKVAPTAAPQPSEFAANIQGQTVWVKLPYLDPTMSQYGLSESGTPLNNSAIIQNISAQAVAIGATVRIPAGEFPISRITLPNNVVFEGAGRDRTLFKRVNDASGAAPAFFGQGSVSTAIPLAANTASFATSITVATNPGYLPGDLVYVTDQRAPWGGSVYPGHDIAPVASVSGTGPYTINLGAVLYHPYSTSSSATVQKITPWNGKMHGFTVDSLDGAVGDVVRLDWSGHRAEVGGIGATRWGATAVFINGGYMSSVDRVYMADPPDTSIGGRGYGVRLEKGSRGIDIGHSEGRKTRHAFDISYGSSANLVHDCFGYDPGLGPDFAVHGAEGYENQFVACTAYTGSTGQGFGVGNNSFGGDFYTVFDRCVGYGVGPSGPAIGMFKAMKGSTGTRFSNCTVNGAYYGYHIHLSDDVSIAGGRTTNMRDGAYIFDSIGASITSHKFKDATVSAVRNLTVNRSGNNALVTGNDFQNCTVNPLQLNFGTGHVTGQNMTR